MIQVEDEDGAGPEWQVPEVTAAPYTVYDLSHPISHLDEYLHIILLCMNAQLHPQVMALCGKRYELVTLDSSPLLHTMLSVGAKHTTIQDTFGKWHGSKSLSFSLPLQST